MGKYGKCAIPPSALHRRSSPPTPEQLQRRTTDSAHAPANYHRGLILNHHYQEVNCRTLINESFAVLMLKMILQSASRFRKNSASINNWMVALKKI